MHIFKLLLTTYIHQVEKQASTLEFFERVGDIKTIKPRCTLLYGKSNNWNKEQKEAYRILNSSYHNLNILTYDHVLSRAKRILGLPADDSPLLQEGLAENTEKIVTAVVVKELTYAVKDKVLSPDDIPF